MTSVSFPVWDLGTLTADYEPHERDVMSELADLARSLPAGSAEKTEALNCARFIHAMKATLDARLFTPDEEAAAELRQIERLVGPPVAHARATDPVTSHAAALTLGSEKLTRNMQAVLACLRLVGPIHHEGLIEKYERLHDQNDWPAQSESGLRTRTKELADRHRVIDSGQRVRLLSGRESIVWKVS